MKKITAKILKKWNPCEAGYQRFLELLPKGGTLSECIDAAIKDDKADWGRWLFYRCQKDDDFKEQTADGYRNSGRWNSGESNPGNWNSGDRNSGDWNSGDRNSGDRNSGGGNAGHCNRGHRNSGDWNSGGWNSGDMNSGDMNSGRRNSGDWNSGDWNLGDRNTGYFNTKTPNEILVFNKPCKRSTWEDCSKPNLIFFAINRWIDESNMTDQEKIANPKFFVTGGYLKTIGYKQAWRESWDKATDEDKQLLYALPNFCPKVFFKISGISVEESKDVTIY